MQPQVCCVGDVSSAPCLQVAAGELAAATRLRQARPSSACIRLELLDTDGGVLCVCWRGVCARMLA